MNAPPNAMRDHAQAVTARRQARVKEWARRAVLGPDLLCDPKLPPNWRAPIQRPRFG